VGIGQNGLFIRLRERVYRRCAAMEVFDIDGIDFQALKLVDVRTADPDTLVDISSVVIPENLTREERMREFVRQIKNPYCFKVGKVAVSVGFSGDGVTFEQRMEHFLRTL